MTETVPSRFPFLANAFVLRAAARARSASAIFAEPVTLTLAANAKENFFASRLMGVEETEVTARRSRDRSVEEGNILNCSVQRKMARRIRKYSWRG